MKLTAENVHNVFIDCLFKTGENTDNHKIGNGILIKVGFKPEKLIEHKEDLNDFIDQIHPFFHKTVGGGWSFLNLCEDKDGNQWADLHTTVDELVCLLNATEQLSYLAPREYWRYFIGGVPYLIINK